MVASLVLWFAVSSFGLLLGGAGFIYWSLLESLDAVDEAFLVDKVDNLVAVLSGRSESRETQAPSQSEAARYASFYVRIVDGSGEIVYQTPGLETELGGTGREWPDGGHTFLGPSGQEFRAFSRTVTGEDGGSRRVQVALGRRHEQLLLRHLRGRAAGFGALAFLGCLLVGYLIVWRGLSPLEAIAQQARRIRAGSLHQRLAGEALPAELLSFTDTVNEMLANLEESFGRLSRFSAELSHELRTPVHNFMGQLQVTLGKTGRTEEQYRSVLFSCLEECQRMMRLMDSMLFLARAESPHSVVRKERLDLAAELSKLVEFYGLTAVDRGVSLRVDCLDGLCVQADRALFQRAVGNLVENSLRHTPMGGTVVVGAREANGGPEVFVRDNGEGIPSEHLPRVFERFYRVGAPNGASASAQLGLGLPLVAAILKAHGGVATLKSEPGKGAIATLLFPDTLESDRHFEGGDGLLQRLPQIKPT